MNYRPITNDQFEKLMAAYNCKPSLKVLSNLAIELYGANVHEFTVYFGNSYDDEYYSQEVSKITAKDKDGTVLNLDIEQETIDNIISQYDLFFYCR